MIQDRLTAKFRSVFAKSSGKAETKRKSAFKPVAAPIADNYTKGRQLSGSFWI